MQFKKIAFLVICFALIFAGCDSKEEIQKQKAIELQEVKNFKLTTTQAKTLNVEKIENGFIFEDYKDKAILVNFFTTTSESCKAQIPHLIKLKEKYKNDFEIISVLLEKNKNNNDVKKLIDNMGINYIITNSKQNFDFAKIIDKIDSVPTMYLYNKTGNFIEKYVGIVPQEMIEINIKKAIK